MKKLMKLFTVLAIVMFTSNTFASELGLKMANLNLYAPAAKSKKSSSSSGGIEKGTMQLDVSFNLGSHSGFGKKSAFGFGGVGVGFSPGVTVNFDYAVHSYASVGGYIGFGGGGVAAGGGKIKGAYIGIGARGVFHIYQLISDKAGTKVDPGKLDFYFPFHVGATILIPGKNTGGKTTAGATVGGGLGVRYYFTKNLGIVSEVGWLELALFKVGFSFKF
ncbi:MAG TPA: hypothetical protein PLX60_07425 [Chitinophagales bacterium]|jgi:hypothetical protein|nr:hypothetical protein [Chitinophagales bacterium]